MALQTGELVVAISQRLQ
ncbi:MAG: hypothetical protein NTV45_05840 [Firmicutes bacterium]|nr:hypothetical protein [Bacillota bacterium]